MVGIYFTCIGQIAWRLPLIYTFRRGEKGVTKREKTELQEERQDGKEDYRQKKIAKLKREQKGKQEWELEQE